VIVTLGRTVPAAPRSSGDEVAASEPSEAPWKPPRNATTSVRPVTFLASFSAASTARVPAGPGNCIT
jgi:hypothetical protein